MVYLNAIGLHQACHNCLRPSPEDKFHHVLMLLSCRLQSAMIVHRFL